MIATLRDDNGNITAVMEYLFFDEEGRMDDNGNIMIVGELEVNPIHRNNGCIKAIVQQILAKHPKIEGCAWARTSKYPNGKVSKYRRDQFEQLVQRKHRGIYG